MLKKGSIHRDIMPLGIAMTCATWCHSGICQSGERRMRGHLYTVAVGSQIKAYTNYASHCQLHLQEVTIRWWMTLWKVLWQTRLDVIAWFRPEMPHCTNAPSSSSLHSGRCCCIIKWHMPMLSQVAQFPREPITNRVYLSLKPGGTWSNFWGRYGPPRFSKVGSAKQIFLAGNLVFFC